MDKEETKCTCETCVRFRNKPLINKNKIIIPFYDDELWREPYKYLIILWKFIKKLKIKLSVFFK